MDESSSRFRIPKTFDEEIYGLQEQMGVADFREQKVRNVLRLMLKSHMM